MLILIFAMIVMYLKWDNIKTLFNPDTIEQGQEITQDEIYDDSVPTIQDILEFRVDVIESQRIDSVFLTLPDAILVTILMNYGTELSNKDIVTIYESNKEDYDKVMQGSASQKLIDSIQQKKDSLSKKDSLDKRI